jgi:cell division protein FtsI (penicillin-binding protein 3)
MEQGSPRWRFELVFGLLILCLAGLSVRLVLLLRDERCRALRLSSRQQRMVVPLPGRVGSIRACGAGSFPLLAGSKQAPLCFADPQLADAEQWSRSCVRLSEVLSPDLAWAQRDLMRWRLYREIMDRREAGRRYYVVARELTDQQVTQIKQLDLPGVRISHEWKREYPCGDLAASVVGFRLRDGRAGGGVELEFDSLLQAEGGRRVMIADVARRPIWPLPAESCKPSDGGTVYLCIDLNIQRYLAEEVRAAVEKFHAEWGAGVVMNPHTGEILAMCSAPTFDPNEYPRYQPERRTNHAIVSPFEPGSVLKPLYAAAAVQEGLVGWDTMIDAEGGTYIVRGGGRIGDHGKDWDRLSVRDAVVRSSNIVMAKLGEKLGNRRLYEWARKMGFGKATGVTLPAESSGILRPLGRWDGYSLRRVPFGQEISVTSLQLIRAFAAIANGGVLLEPRLIHHAVDSRGGRLDVPGQEAGRIFSEEVSREARRVMEGVVADEHGTGRRARLDRWTSFGKTGTAQVAEPNGGGYNDTDYVGSYIGGAPVERPAVLCLISIYKPDRKIGYYGGTVAGPGVARVLERTLEYLRVPPDKEDLRVARP